MKKVILGSVMIFTGVFAFVQMFNIVSVMTMSYISDVVFLTVLFAGLVAMALAILAVLGVVIGYKGAFDKTNKQEEKATDENNG